MMTKTVKSLFFYLTPLALGALATFAFAPYEVFPLAILAPAGLLMLMHHTTPKQSFWLSYLFGLGLFGAGTYWVYISINLYGDIPFIFSIIITGLFAGAMALYPAVVGYLTKRYFSSQTSTLLAFPAIWVLFEWIRSWLLTGFPWLFLGYSQTNSPLKGFAPILSVYGVSIVVLLSSSLLVNTIYQYKQRRYHYTYLSLFLLLTLWIMGAALNLFTWTSTIGKPQSISLVQGNIKQEVKWSPEFLQQSLDRYDQLTRPLWGKHQLIIWPEAAIPLPLQNAGGYIESLDEKAKKSHTHLILGIPIQSSDGTGYYNAVVTLGSTKQVYLKRRLVPFGEYVPFYDILQPYLTQFNIPVANSLPGKSAQKPLVFDDLKLLVAICYEIAFPEMVNTKDSTINAILTVTNDAWFGKSAAQAQHLQMGAMRALELRRPVIFVSNNGITAILGPDGRIESAIPTHRTATLNTTIQPMTGLTPWMRYGMDPVLIILIALLIAAGALREPITLKTNASTVRRRGKRARRSQTEKKHSSTHYTDEKVHEQS